MRDQGGGGGGGQGFALHEHHLLNSRGAPHDTQPSPTSEGEVHLDAGGA